MTAGRKPNTHQDITDIELDQAKIDGAMVAMRDHVQEEQLELLELSSDVGALRAFDYVGKSVAAATVHLFNKVRESKQINKLPIRLADGT